MARIEQYTAQVAPQQLNTAQATPQAFGGNTAGLQAQAQGMSDVAQAAKGFSQQIQAVQQQRQSRIDTVNKVRAERGFYDDVFNEYNRARAEMDLIDPETANQFNQSLRDKADEYLMNFNGSEGARLELEEKIYTTLGTFSRQMQEDSISAQRKFLMQSAEAEINDIVGMVRRDPSKIEQAFMDAGNIAGKYAPGLYAEDELDMSEAAQRQIVMGVLQSYTDNADYEGAREFVNNYSVFMDKIPQEKLRPIMQQIEGGLREREDAVRDMQNRSAVLDVALAKSGAEVTPAERLSFLTGIQKSTGPEQKLEEYARLTKRNADDLTKEEVLTIGFGIDPSKVSGDPTTDEIWKFIKTPFETAGNTKVQVDKVLNQADEFLANNNKQAGLAAMIAFQKLIDDGAAVREGDIRLSAQGNSAYDNLKLMMDRLGEGAIATPAQIEEMKRSAEIFGQSVLEASKTYIDPYIENARSRGINPMSFGLPQESYDLVFGNVKTQVPSTTQNPAALETLQGRANEFGIPLDQMISTLAQEAGMTEEEFKSTIGYK